MSYVGENLLAGERVVYRTSLHKVVFAWPVIILVFGFLAWSVSAGAGLTIILIAAGVGLFALLNYRSSEFAVTNKRVLVKVGILSRRSLEMLLNKIESISVHQDLIGRCCGYGTIVVSGTGGTKEPFKMITEPLTFRKQVQEQISMVQTDLLP